MSAEYNLSAKALSSLLDASQAINSAQGLDQTFDAIARVAAAVMAAEASSVITLDKARNRQTFRAAVGDHAQSLLGIEFDASLGLSGKAMAGRQPTIFNDIPRDKDNYQEFDLKLPFVTRSLIAAPLIHQGEVLGVVEVINPLRTEKFTQQDLELAQIFANLAAAAATNAQLVDRLSRQTHIYKESLRRDSRMLGASPAIGQVHELMARVARAMATVLLTGESGTGKELAARTIHEHSPRAQKAFIAVNCAAIPETLLESELFGHEAGAFTGATGKRLGRFELADEGTIFLDEIGELAPSIQVKLLRVLQEKEFVRVGGMATVGCDVRVIAATNRNLETLMREGRFREDLYYRLNVFPITIPPLRERRQDIPILTENFLNRLAGDLGVPVPRLTGPAMRALGGYAYPGNIRELQNILERACLLADNGAIDLPQLPHALTGPLGGLAPEPNALDDMERGMILHALQANNWNQSRTAKALNISRDHLRYRIRKFKLSPPAEGTPGPFASHGH